MFFNIFRDCQNYYYYYYYCYYYCYYFSHSV